MYILCFPSTLIYCYVLKVKILNNIPTYLLICERYLPIVYLMSLLVARKECHGLFVAFLKDIKEVDK